MNSIFDEVIMKNEARRVNISYNFDKEIIKKVKRKMRKSILLLV